MSSINMNTSIRQQVAVQSTQQTQQMQETKAVESANRVQGPEGMIEQDASDVSRMGSSGRLRRRDGKAKERDALDKVRKGLGSEKVEKANEVESQGVNTFVKRRRASTKEEDKDFARQAVEDILKEIQKDFTDAEAAAILNSLKENPVVAKDVVLKEAIEDQITEIIQNSLSTQMEIASAGIMPGSGIGRSQQVEVREKAVLGYTTQEQVLEDLEGTFGKEKISQEFPTVCSHMMAELSASMSSLAVARGGEKSAVYAAAAGISSLQQLTGVHVEAQRMLSRMEERYPK